MKNLFLLIFIVLSTLLFSQKTEEYSGIITLENGSALIFEMEFIQDKGIVNGFSITGKGTPEETKSDISGIFNRNTKTYKLKETQVLSTNSEADLNTFCYISMEITELGKLYLKRYEGNFTGHFTNGDTCARGKIVMMEKEKLEKKVEKVKKKIEKKIEKQKKEEINVLSTKTLKDGNEMIIKCYSDKIIIYIWDANQEDGDRISLKVNGKYLLENYTTTRKRKKIKYKIQEGENIIEITATNLGSSPPNTSRIEIVDSKTKYPIITQLELNKIAIIKIVS